MDVTLRSVNDVFLERIVFPAFSLGMRRFDQAAAVLLDRVLDESLRVKLELLVDEHGAEPLSELTDERWVHVVHQLLFGEWVPDGDDWVPALLTSAFVDAWDRATTLALMLEDPSFDYTDAAVSEVAVRSFWGKPKLACPFASMLCGVWTRPPGFPPEVVFTAAGPRAASTSGGLVRASWTWRPVETVAEWAARLPSVLSRLLEREVRRLRPVEVPERHAILDFWLGRAEEPPLLSVCFSGLGERSFAWIRQIGVLARHLRGTAAAERGLTLVLTPTEEPSNTIV